MKYQFEQIKNHKNEALPKYSVSVTDGVSADDIALKVPSKNDEYIILPGLVDVHVHLREPGFSYKETILDGTRAAAHGGFTTVFSMPNLSPCPDTAEHLQEQLDIISRDAVINVLPYGTISKGENGKELSDMDNLSENVIAFSDDGRGVQSDDLMRSAMEKAKALGKVIVAHCEDNSLLFGGYIHDGEYAKAHGHRGICSESEYGQIARDIELVRQTGCSYHVCHISTKESVELIRKAKADGLDITCETAPHYLLLDDSYMQEDARFKMNPPLRDKSDRLALIEGIKDGTIDMIITDHAPHSAEEKSRGLEKSPMGVVGIETSFPLVYTYLVKTGIITLEKAIELMHFNPLKRFRLEENENDFTIFEIANEYTVNPDDFLSKGRSTPFTGWKVYGKCMLTVCNGRQAYISNELTKGN